MLSFSREITFSIISRSRDRIYGSLHLVVEEINAARTTAEQSMKLPARLDLHFRWFLELIRVYQYIQLKSKNSTKLALKIVQKCKVSLCKLQFGLENTISTMLAWLYPIKGRNFKSVRERIAMGPSLRHYYSRWRRFTPEKIRRVDKSYNWTLAFV